MTQPFSTGAGRLVSHCAARHFSAPDGRAAGDRCGGVRGDAAGRLTRRRGSRIFPGCWSISITSRTIRRSRRRRRAGSAALEHRDDGLYAQIRWSDLGHQALTGGRYRLASPVWNRADCDAVDGARADGREVAASASAAAGSAGADERSESAGAGAAVQPAGAATETMSIHRDGSYDRRYNG